MKIPSLLITLTIAGTLAAVSPQLHAQTPAQDAAAKALFREGRDFLDDGKYADAEKRFREALSKYPRAEQADRTSFYLIATLIKLGRTDEASAEVLSFNRKFPQSTWKTDVEEKRITLGLPAAPFGPVYRIHAIPQMPAPLQVPAGYSAGLSKAFRMRVACAPPFAANSRRVRPVREKASWRSRQMRRAN